MTFFLLRRSGVKKKKFGLKAFFFIRAGARAGEKILGAGQKCTGSVTLLVSTGTFLISAVFRILAFCANPVPDPMRIYPYFLL